MTDDRCAFTVKEFCKAHRISVSQYYAMKKIGIGPREMRARNKILISIEAAKDWRRQRETVEPPPAA